MAIEKTEQIGVRLRKAALADADRFPEVEQSAGFAFTVDPELAWLAHAENYSAQRYREIVAEGWSWVADDGGSELVAFLAAAREGDDLHIWEFNVRLEYQRQGLGRRLVERFIADASAAGISGVTLTTFRDVRWNMPFYRAIGFEPISPENYGPRLEGVLADEVRKGLPLARRCAMRREILR